MPLELTSAGQPVQLSTGTSMQLEYNSPLFDEDTIKGTFSYSFTLPALPNGPLYGYPERPDRAATPGAQLPAELALDGVPLLTGSQRIKSASPAKYSVNLQAGLSGANLSERQLSSFSYGGLRAVPRYEAQPDPSGTTYYVSGLTVHANEVVANPSDYDYVFAPLRNEYLAEPGPGTPDPLSYPPTNTVNLWSVLPLPIGGLPAGGTFSAPLLLREPSYVDMQDGLSDGLPPYCPFPRLRYVLQRIFEESGLQVDVANLLPGELGELVIAGNAHLVDRGNAHELRFSLADVLPALTVAELLAALRQDLGVVVYLDQATGRVRTAYLVERVAADAAYLDLSAQLAGYPEVSIEEPTGLTLTAQVDSGDELTKDALAKQPDPSLLLPAVATAADLPAYAVLSDNPKTGQVRLVEQEGMYYACTIVGGSQLNVALSWAQLVPALPAVLVNGGGDEQAQRICYTAEQATELQAASGVTIALPAISQPPYRADQTAIERSTALRLLFYRGLQLASDGVMSCPQLSHLSPSGALSLRLAGEAGTYAQLLQTWLPIKLSGVSYKQPLLLSALDLSRLDLTRQVWLDGVAYLVKKLSASVPLKKVATVELVRL
jgi:hypothetical protein